MEMTAAALYGGSPMPQPTGTAVVDHPAGTHEPKVRTLPRPNAKGVLGNPVFVLVALLGIAFVVLHLSVHGTIAVGVGS